MKLSLNTAQGWNGSLDAALAAQVPSLRCTGAQEVLQSRVPGLWDSSTAQGEAAHPSALPGAAAPATPATEGKAGAVGIKIIPFVTQIRLLPGCV